MALATKATGPMASLRETAHSSTRTATSTRVSGAITSASGMESISIKMEPPMLGTGKMTYNRDREKRFGLRAHGTRVIMLKARNSASASTPGPTALFTKDIGEITKSMASANTFGKTADGTTATGRTTICQAMASTSTQTA